MFLGRVSTVAPRANAATTFACTAAQRRFLAKGAKGRPGGPVKHAGGRGRGAGKPAAGAAAATPPPPPPTPAAKTAASAITKTSPGGGGGGFTRSEMLAARQARKESLAKTAAAAPAVQRTAAAAAVGKSGAVPGAGAGGAGGRAGAGEGARQGKWGLGMKTLVATSTGLAALGIAWKLKPDEVRKLLDDSPIDHFAIWLMSKYSLYASPVKDKLLPELPLGPGQQQPPVLVLDLEGTLVGTVYTRKNGWRVAKRPGLEAFLREMAQQYEVIVFTDSGPAFADEWITKMDPHNQLIHGRLFREGTRYINGKYVKDLSALNRPLDKVVIVDDNADCLSLQPENGIHVKKFSLEDGSDPTADTVLYDLAPFLVALATQGVADFRDVLRPHIGKDYTSVVSDYRSRVSAVRQKEEELRGRGLGGFVRQIAPAMGSGGRGGAMGGGVVTSKDIVGDAPDILPPGTAMTSSGGGSSAGPMRVVPVAPEKKGRLWKNLEEGTREMQEELMRKNEVFHRVMEKRMAREQAREKARQEAQEARKA